MAKETPKVLSKWFEHNSSWFRENHITWDEALYHSFFTKEELLKEIDGLRYEIKTGHMIMLIDNGKNEKKKKVDAPTVLSKWFQQNDKWFKENHITWDEAVYHSFFTKGELLREIDGLKEEVQKGHLILLLKKK